MESFTDTALLSGSHRSRALEQMADSVIFTVASGTERAQLLAVAVKVVPACWNGIMN